MPQRKNGGFAMTNDDNDDPHAAERALFESIKDGIIAAQGLAIMNRVVLREIVGQIAREQSDPGRYLRNLFERASARLDEGPERIQIKEAAGFSREMLVKFISLIEQDISDGPASPGSASPAAE
jgi:hypothetical protein